MFSKESYIVKAKKEAANYLKMTSAMGIIRSKVCQELANEIEALEPDNYLGVIGLLKKYTTREMSPKPLKGCHRHFFEKLKMLYKQIKYDRELQEVINGNYSLYKEADSVV